MTRAALRYAATRAACWAAFGAATYLAVTASTPVDVACAASAMLGAVEATLVTAIRTEQHRTTTPREDTR